MANEGYDDDVWDDANFLEQLDQAVELASAQLSHPPPPPPPQRQSAAAAPQFVDISYSPPRELSQRVNKETTSSTSQASNQSTHADSGRTAPEDSVPLEPHNAQEQEIHRLKRELDRASEMLAQKERECIELRKERDRKERNVVQTENVGVSTNLTGESDFSAAYRCKQKLLDAWESSTGQKLGRVLVLKLLQTCEADFRILFEFLDSSFPSKTRTEISLSESRMAKEENLTQDHLSVSTKVSHLYSVLTKIGNEMIRWDGLLDALVDLCRLKNVVIMYRALHILHEVLSCVFCTERNEDRRSNLIIEEPLEENVLEIDENGYSRRGSHPKEALDQSHAPCGARLDNSDTFSRMGLGTSVSTSCLNYLSLFELMCQIIMINDLEHIRWEAISIMNLILVRNRSYSEMEKCGSDIVFQSVSQLLRKEAGCRVQKQAVRHLYLLLNCPKVMASFSNSFMEGKSMGTADATEKNTSAFQVICKIFEGLADCISCSGKSTEELQVQRRSIILLAFLASSGKTGIEVLLNHRLPKRINFLTIILQSLMSVLDLEASDTAGFPEDSKERTLMIREALILLNRLVSHPQYAASVLRALTSRRDIARLTFEIASRLSRKGKCLLHCDSVTQQIRESEIVELARVFQKRVYTFVGSNTSAKRPS